MSESHVTSVSTVGDKRVARCTCGWVDAWSAFDGSAEQSASEHKRARGTT